MSRLLQLLFPLHASANPARRWQTVVLYVGFVACVSVRLFLLLPDVAEDTAERLGWTISLFTLANLAIILGASTAYYYTRRVALLRAGRLLTIVLLAEAALYLLGDSWESLRGWGALWAGIGLGGLLLTRRESRAAVVAGIVLIAVSAFESAADLPPAARSERAAVALTLGGWALAVGIGVRAVSHSSQTALRAASPVSSNRHLIEIGEMIAQSVFERAEIDTFLQSMAESISQRFTTIYHVQIYLIPLESERANLVAATGAIGQQLVIQEHKVDVGGLTPVGRATRTGSPQLVSDYSKETVRTPNPLLPGTRCELAIPLQAGSRVLGALDVQSREPEALSQGDVALLTALTAQLAVAVDALQLHASVQRSLRENQALHQQTQINLREIERLNYQLTGHAWSDYLRLQSDSTAITLDVTSGQTQSQAAWTPTLDEAARHRQVITVTQEGQRIVALPIIVRSEVVGAMEFELTSDDELPEGALDLVTAVGQRLGLAMENRRLFDETQRVAQREALINDIGAELQAATSVEAILQRAAQHLQDTLAARQVTIRLGVPPARREPAQRA